MSHYPLDTIERVIVNLSRKEDLTEAYDLMLDSPRLRHEMEQDNLTAAELLERIVARCGRGGS